MAPLTNTATHTATAGSAPTLNPTDQSFVGDEFSNNLFSDLAPLLTLFGEQVTKQFLSMSMGWADNVLLAMGPLGILTTVVSAIRVGGVRKLKALVGRARESLHTAEQELLSSTSDTVCEMWSGSDIVRQLGKPKTMDLILVKSFTHPAVINLADSMKHSYMREVATNGQRLLRPSEVEKFASQAPNLALNAKGSSLRKMELWSWAVLGVVLQSVALAFPALTSYLWKFPKGVSSVQGYAYPCFIVGTLAVTFGVILCSHVIEQVTVERTLKPSAIHPSLEVFQVVRLQRECTVSDQSFRPFLIWNAPGNNTLRTSRLRDIIDPRLSKLAAFASVLAVCGFICQFVGLRGLHWSATILQLGITLIMTGARSWVRRGLAVELPALALISECELELTAMALNTCATGPEFGPIGSAENQRDLTDDLDQRTKIGWEIVTGEKSPAGICLPQGLLATKLEIRSGDFFERLLSIQNDLRDVIPDMSHHAAVSEISLSLVKTIGGIIRAYERAISNRMLLVKPRTRGNRGFEWSHHVKYCESNEWKLGRISCEWREEYSERWGRDFEDISAKDDSDLEVNMLDPFTGFVRSIIGFWACSLRYRTKGQPRLWSRVIGQEGDFELCEIQRWSETRIVSQAGVVEASPGPPTNASRVFGVSTMTVPKSNEDANLTPVREINCFSAHYDIEEFASYEGNLLNSCALELLAGFVSSLAASINCIGGSTSSHPRNNSWLIGAIEGELWVNSILDNFANIVSDYGLVTTRKAKAIIIPPFAKRGLLPTQLGNVIFDGPSKGSNSQPEDQKDKMTPPEPHQQADSKNNAQTDASASESTQETTNENAKLELQLDETTKLEAQTTSTKLGNAEKNGEEKEDMDFHALQPEDSGTEGRENEEGERKRD